MKELKQIPSIGISIANDLFSLNIRSVADLRDKNPEKMYHELCLKAEEKIDRCMLYVFCCAIYFASHSSHDPERLRWWNWKDK